MIKYDYHIHTNNSNDGKSTMEEYIQKAIEQGLDGLCVTDHWDIYDDIKESKLQTIDMEKYANEYNSIKEKYGNLLNLRFGIEIGLRPEIVGQVKELVSKYKFDFIIGSSHIVNRIDVGQNSKEFFKDNDVENGYRKYLEEVYRNIILFDEFDVYGHIDYIVRYSETDDKYMEYLVYEDLLDKILLELIKKGKGIEINTSGFRYGLNSPHPNYEILKRYKELNGEILTVGSDSHSTDYLCYKFDLIKNKLKEIGFNNITYYEGREAKFFKL